MIVPEREIPWMEKGLIRYALGSYGLWVRHIYYDIRRVKPRKKFK